MTGRWSQWDQRVRSVAAEERVSVFDQTLAGCVQSVLTYADVGCIEETLSDQTLGESGRARPDASGRENSRLEPYWK